jgi:hypothetical protein
MVRPELTGLMYLTQEASEFVDKNVAPEADSGKTFQVVPSSEYCKNVEKRHFGMAVLLYKVSFGAAAVKVGGVIVRAVAPTVYTWLVTAPV